MDDDDNIYTNNNNINNINNTMPFNDLTSSYSTLSTMHPDLSLSHSSSDLNNNYFSASSNRIEPTILEHQPINNILPTFDEPLISPPLLHFEWIGKYGSIPDTIVLPTDEDTLLLQRYLNSPQHSNNNFVQIWKQAFETHRFPHNSKSKQEIPNTNSVSVNSIIGAANQAKVNLTAQTNIGGKLKLKTPKSNQPKTIIEINSDNNCESDKSDDTDFNTVKPNQKNKRRRRY